MGILNFTTDSFYDGGKYSEHDIRIAQCEKMISEGAHIIDVGAFSSRPGADFISTEEEKSRLLPDLESLSKRFPQTIFSVDTFRSEVAEAAYNHGADIINDISGGTLDNNMFLKVSQLDIPYILMHMHGNPQTMQMAPIKNNVVEKISSFFMDSFEKLSGLGVKDIILDPGYGFGKSLESNYELLKKQEDVRINNLPILTGLSRKSMIYKILNNSPEEALSGTITLNTIALQNGANILRVHDVKEAVQCIKLFEFYDNIDE
ncbi:MAG: dihydropteroate synthase [Marinilabiliales bacterium]|nr:MAG: dihydropteroate synthase [Marinilabiliales bacterium]